MSNDRRFDWPREYTPTGSVIVYELWERPMYDERKRLHDIGIDIGRMVWPKVWIDPALAPSWLLR